MQTTDVIWLENTKWFFHSERYFWNMLVSVLATVQHGKMILRQSCLVQINLLNTTCFLCIAFFWRKGGFCHPVCISLRLLFSLLYINKHGFLTSSDKTLSVLSWLCCWLLAVLCLPFRKSCSNLVESGWLCFIYINKGIIIVIIHIHITLYVFFYRLTCENVRISSWDLGLLSTLHVYNEKISLFFSGSKL